MKSNSISIQTERLNKKFDKVHAVKNLDLELDIGSRFGFLGPLPGRFLLLCQLSYIASTHWKNQRGTAKGVQPLGNPLTV